MNDKDNCQAKKILIQLPGIAQHPTIAQQYELELEPLDPIGAEIIDVGWKDTETFFKHAGEVDAVLTSWGVRFDTEAIKALKKCAIISVGSIGTDMVDGEAATEAGIVVTNVPDIFIEEVADHAMMFLLGLNKLVKKMMRFTDEGRWWETRPIPSAIPRLRGQTLGILGLGNVGTAVTRRAKPFGLNVIAYDPYVSELKMASEDVEPVSFDELVKRSDYISIHAPDNPETNQIFNAEAFKKMKSTAVIINTSRGTLIDEKALIKALEDGDIAGAALDVLQQEPPAEDHPLRKMDNVILTPHSASASTRMRRETRRRAAREVALTLTGRWPLSCVTPQVLPRMELARWQPYPMDHGPNR